jgi:hypothetical protein
MARTNIEDTGFTKALELSHLIEWDVGRALGALAWLWHESQAKCRLSGTASEILRWSKVKLSDDEALSYLEALIELDLIRPVLENGSLLENEFEIAGNDDEVKRLVMYKERSKKGGESTRKKYESEKERASSLASSQLGGGPDQISSDHIKSDQIKNMSEPNGSTRVRFDFESLYKKYPRKEGKADGLKRCKAQIKTPEAFAELSQAIDKYKSHVHSKGLEEKYIKHFSTFMNSWRDWLDPETGSAESSVIDFAAIARGVGAAYDS